MSDRTHQYRNLTRRDPATTAELYTRDGSGNPIPVAHSTDGKLVVEVSGGATGGGVIQAKAPGATPSDPRVTVDLYATADRELLVAPKDDALVALRGLVPEDPGVTPAYLIDLGATADGELTVALPGGAVVRAVEYGTSNQMDLTTTADAALRVAIQQSITVPVEVQGIAEVKATSANFWALSKGNGPVVIPGFTDADGWFDARAFSRFSAAGIGTSYTWDAAAKFVARAGTVHEVTTYAELTAAITAAAAGDTILLRDGIYEVPTGSLTIGKRLLVIGESRDGVVIQTPVQAAPGVNHVVTISANNVEIRNLTIYHRQTAVSVEQQESCINVSAGTVGTIIDTCRIVYMEFGLVMRGQFSIRACQLDYSPTGPAAPGTYRAIALYGMTADSEVVDVTANFIAGNTPRFMWLGATGSDTYAGELVVARCSLGAGYVHQWIEIPSLPGAVGAFSLAVVDNTFSTGNANIIFSTSSNTDVLGTLTLSGNTVTRVDKGLFGTDGARTTPLALHVDGNTSSLPGTLRVDYIPLFADWAVTARNTVNTQYTVIGDAIIPDFGIPVETGSSVLLDDHVHVDVKYRISMEEPHEHDLASANLNGAYHQIQNPIEPKDILGIGHMRMVGRDSADRGGYFAVFGSMK